MQNIQYKHLNKSKELGTFSDLSGTVFIDYICRIIRLSGGMLILEAEISEVLEEEFSCHDRSLE